MEENKKKARTFMFEEEVIAHSKKNAAIKSFPEWACENYKQQFMSQEAKEKQLEDAEKVAQGLREDIESMKRANSLDILKDQEKEWIRSKGIERAAKSSEEGVYMYFVNKFNRPDITRRQFKLLMEEIKNG